MLIKRTCKRYNETLIMTIEDVKTSLNIGTQTMGISSRVNNIITKLHNQEQHEDYLHMYEPLNLETMQADEIKELQRLIMKQNGFSDTDINNIL